MRILIVEDEPSMAELLRKGLEEERHSITSAFDGPSALEIAGNAEFDVILLDVMLPGVDGIKVARQLRNANNNTPVLMLTALDSVPDIVRGLDAGADDYLIKPFSFTELLARLRSSARRGPIPRPVQLKVSNLMLDSSTHRVYRAGREIHLTGTEFRLLEYLMRRAGRVIPRRALIEGVWSDSENIEDNNLDAFVSFLRNKVDKGHGRKLIHTVRGIGYSLRDQS
ncbi:MAG TPA: response regulator transcription factor [Candidatus Angelobacter sp.]|jgi:DNA-binding response OmpR family regulator|nr:response regulator transcription factor [Candidatus Angelobacter sp.]